MISVEVNAVLAPVSDDETACGWYMGGTESVRRKTK